jgi:hypothetical protein
VNARQKIIVAAEGVQAAALTALVLGGALCFGGAVWWSRPALVWLAFLLVGARLVHILAEGRMPWVKSPLTPLGVLLLALGVVQSLPLPPRLAGRLSPVAHEVYATGSWADRVRSDDPEAELPVPAPVRSPATLDRVATLRWLVWAAVCLGIFWAVTHYVDRLGRLYWVWGSVLAAFLVNTALAAVQIGGQSEGWFGFLLPERAPAWGPSLDDLLESPAPSALRRLDAPPSPARPGPERIASVPERPFLFGTMVGGPGALLAMGAMALPIALAIVLHVLAPRGSRERLAERLGHSGQGGLALLLVLLLVVGAFLAGLMAGPWFCLPFAVALAVVGLPSARAPGGRWSALGLTLLVLAALGLGAAAVAAWPVVVGGQPPAPAVSWESTRHLWSDALRILGDFPWLGTGFGSFGTIHAYYKTQDPSATAALSSLLRCAVEAGIVGFALPVLAGLWSLSRLPARLRQVGSADRTLAHGLLGALVGLGLWSSVSWTIELPAVAIAASALGGMWNRWMAGGTDLFVASGSRRYAVGSTQWQ